MVGAFVVVNEALEGTKLDPFNKKGWRMDALEVGIVASNVVGACTESSMALEVATSEEEEESEE